MDFKKHTEYAKSIEYKRKVGVKPYWVFIILQIFQFFSQKVLFYFFSMIRKTVIFKIAVKDKIKHFKDVKRP